MAAGRPPEREFPDFGFGFGEGDLTVGFAQLGFVDEGEVALVIGRFNLHLFGRVEFAAVLGMDG